MGCKVIKIEVFLTFVEDSRALGEKTRSAVKDELDKKDKTDAKK